MPVLVARVLLRQVLLCSVTWREKHKALHDDEKITFALDVWSAVSALLPSRNDLKKTSIIDSVGLKGSRIELFRFDNKLVSLV